MHRSLFSALVLGLSFLLSACLYDHPPSGPSCDIDTWLIGQWKAVDKSGHACSAVMSRASADHYHLQLDTPGKAAMEFDGWISRIDGFPILVLRSLDSGPTPGKCSLFHYELLAPSKPLPGEVGATRIRIRELQLDESCRTLDPFHLRKAIRSALRAGTLLPAYDVVAEKTRQAAEKKAYAADAVYLKSFLSSGRIKAGTNAPASSVEVPGSVIWTKTGGVTLKGETF